MLCGIIKPLNCDLTYKSDIGYIFVAQGGTRTLSVAVSLCMHVCMQRHRPTLNTIAAEKPTVRPFNISPRAEILLACPVLVNCFAASMALPDMISVSARSVRYGSLNCEPERPMLK